MLHDWLVALAGAPWVYLALFALATIDGFFPPVPSESVVIALSALSVSAGAPNPALVVLFAAAGAFAGDQVAYAVGSRIDVRRLRILRNPRGQRTVDCAERALAQRGPPFILAARFVPIGRVAVNLTAGAVRYPRRTFVGLTALAAVMWSLYSVAIGLLAGAWIQDRPAVAIAVGVLGGVLSGILLDWGLSRRQAHHPRMVERVDAGSAVWVRPPDPDDQRAARALLHPGRHALPVRREAGALLNGIVAPCTAIVPRLPKTPLRANTHGRDLCAAGTSGSCCPGSEMTTSAPPPGASPRVTVPPCD
jgi:membrane protein DedA with SNARE-associated domain